MVVERWDPERHRTVVLGWLRAHGIDLSKFDDRMLPQTGFVVDGCAVGFMYHTDSQLAFFDAIATDPTAPSSRRHAALDRLITALRDEARRSGYTAIAGTPSRPSLIARFARHGFAVLEGCAYTVGGVECPGSQQ